MSNFDPTDPELVFVNNKLFADLYLNNAFPYCSATTWYLQTFYRIVDTRPEALERVASSLAESSIRKVLPNLAGMRFFRRDELVWHLRAAYDIEIDAAHESVIIERLCYRDWLSDVEFLFGICLWPGCIYTGFGAVVYKRNNELFLTKFEEIDSCDLYIINHRWDEIPVSWVSLYDELRRDPHEPNDEENGIEYTEEEEADSAAYIQSANADLRQYHLKITAMLSPLVKRHLPLDTFNTIWGEAEKRAKDMGWTWNGLPCGWPRANARHNVS